MNGRHRKVAAVFRFPSPILPSPASIAPMKSFLLMLLTFVVAVAVVIGGGALFYLSKTSEYSRTEKTPPSSSP